MYVCGGGGGGGGGQEGDHIREQLAAVLPSSTPHSVSKRQEPG